MNSSEASSSMSQPYQVFLSFRGEDTRYSFTDFLYARLVERGYQVFRDKEGITCGQTIRSTLQVAIHESRVSIVVLSKNYASSKWCLDELVMIMNRHEQEGHNVLPVFYQVDPSDVRNERGSSAEYKDEMERVRGWRAALQKVGELKGEHVNITEKSYETEVIERMVEEVGTIIGNEPKEIKYAFPVSNLVGQGFQIALKNIWSLLMKDEVTRIGVYGMGGVGKTTVMKHINNQLLQASQGFPRVYCITASQDCDEDRLQTLIGKSIGLDLSNEVDRMHRAGRLNDKLAKESSFVLIIDDLWQHFDLEEIGLSPMQNEYKLIFISRSLDVCRQMDCQNKNIIKVEPLSPEEGWVLFERELGAYNIKVEQQAKEIVSECAGLPLAIKTMGRSMRGVADKVVWRNAVDKIKNPKIGKNHMDPVFDILRFSYRRLNDSSLQQCLLYCALFPEDFEIERKELIEYLIVEGIVKRKKCRREEVDEGQVMLTDLVNLCLLEEVDGFVKVKMHDLIRDMGLKILNEESSVMVEAGKGLTECPDSDEWEQSLVRVSLRLNKIREIGSNHSPICPNLSTLLLSQNYWLDMISNCFFERLDGLKVLDLSYTRIQRLPESISNLVRLSALLLGSCHRLMHIPSLAKLIALEKLDLRWCVKIEEVPHGMEFQRKLRYLDLEECRKLKEFPAGILSKLSRLQVLRIDLKLRLKGEEVGCLKKLEDLACSFPNLEELNKYLRFAKPPHKFHIYVNPTGRRQFVQGKKCLNFSDSDLRMGGDFYKIPEGIEALVIQKCKLDAGCLSDSACVLNAASELKSIASISCEEVERIASFSGLSANIFSTLEKLYLERLSNLCGLIPYEYENENYDPLALLCTQTFGSLKTIKITDCDSIKKLFPRGLLRNLQNLEDIYVECCVGLEEIVASEESSSTDYSSHFVTLPKLRVLRLSFLPSLESIFSGKLICESLQFLTVVDCGMLKRIPISLPLSSIIKINVGPRKWWEQEVKWDHPDAKQILQPWIWFPYNFRDETSNQR